MQINTVNVQLLIFRAKKLAGWVEGRKDGWMDGWKEGWESRVKDCLQQSKRAPLGGANIKKIDFNLLQVLKNLSFLH